MLERNMQRESMSRLLARSGGGDCRAFSELYRLSAPRLLPYAFRIVKTNALAEDVLQESFMAIWRGAAAFDQTRSAPFTWMATIVRNKAVDYMRANQLQNQLTEWGDEGAATLRYADPSTQPCDAAANAQCREMIGFALTRLDALPRRAIELAYFHDLSHGEVANAMTAPLGTVKTWIRRGCISLRRHVEPALR